MPWGGIGTINPVRPISIYALIDRRRRRKQALAQSVRRRAGRAALGCGAAALLAVVFAMLVFGLGYADLVRGLPSPSLLPGMFDPESGELMQPTRLYDRSGHHLLLTLENPGIRRRYLVVDPQIGRAS